jgi:hypothetical protein
MSFRTESANLRNRAHQRNEASDLIVIGTSYFFMLVERLGATIVHKFRNDGLCMTFGLSYLHGHMYRAFKVDFTRGFCGNHFRIDSTFHLDSDKVPIRVLSVPIKSVLPKEEETKGFATSSRWRGQMVQQI